MVVPAIKGETSANEQSEQLYFEAKNIIESTDKSLTQEQKNRMNEVLEIVCNAIPNELEDFIAFETQMSENINKQQLVFESQKAKDQYWETRIFGHIFEMYTETEHHLERELQNIKNPAERLKQVDEVALSHELIKIARNPRAYGLFKKLGARVPDGIAMTFNEETGELTIGELIEVKASEFLDDRALDQISAGGSRQTIKNLVDELNDVLANRDFSAHEDTTREWTKEDFGFNANQQKLANLKQLLNGVRIKVADQISIQIVMAANRHVPDTELIKRTDLNEDELEQKTIAVRTLEALVGNAEVDEHKIHEEVAQGTVKFKKSMFSTKNARDMYRLIKEQGLLENLPGEVVVHKHETTTNYEQADDSYERIKILVAHVEDPEQYLTWLHKYMNIGMNANAKKDREHIKSDFNGKEYTSLHKVSGISATGSDEKDSKKHLEEKIDAHFEDWRELLFKQFSDARDLFALDKKTLTTEQREYIDTVFKQIIQEKTV